MGGKSSKENQRFLQDWYQLQKEGITGAMSNVWAKKSNRRIQMEQYNLHVTSKEEVKSEQRLHQLRHNHPMLVSSLHFQDETKEQFCSSDYKGKIFLQRIPLTLQTITDIPFPDALHVYSQSLQGFHILSNQAQTGCFPVSEQLIGVNNEGVVKVWMNDKYERTFPSRNQRIPQDRMVRLIFTAIDQNVDFQSLEGRPRLTQYIYRKSGSPSDVRFGQAINLVRNYANEFYGGLIPDRLTCVDRVGGAYQLSKNWKSKYQKSRRYGSESGNSDHLYQNFDKNKHDFVNTNANLNNNNNGESQMTVMRNNATVVPSRFVRQNHHMTSTFNNNNNNISQGPSQQSIREEVRATQMHSVPTYPSQHFHTFRDTAPSFKLTQSQMRQNANENVNTHFNTNNNLNTVRVVPHQQTGTVVFSQSQVRDAPPTQNHIVVNHHQQQRFNESTVQNRVTPNNTELRASKVNFTKPTSSTIVRSQFTPTPIVIQQQQLQQQNVHVHRQPLPQQPHFRSNNVNFVNSNTSVPVSFNPVSHNQQEKTQSKLVFVPGVQHHHPHHHQQPIIQYRNNNQESVISSITNGGHTTQLRSKQEISGRFSQVREQPSVIDNSTRKFYNDMLGQNNNTSNNVNNVNFTNNTSNNNNTYQNGTLPSTNYYAAYTNKLYEAGSQTDSNTGGQSYQFQTRDINVPATNYGTTNYGSTNTYGTSTANYQQDDYKSSNYERSSSYKNTNLENSNARSDYKNISNDDGMSSLAFLNQLKNMKFTTKTDQVDLGGGSYYTHSTTQGRDPITGLTIKEDDQDYRVSYHNQQDNNNNDDNLMVVGQKIAISSTDKYGNEQTEVYQQENYETLGGNVRYESQYVKVTNTNSIENYQSENAYQRQSEGSYAVEDQGQYQSYFDKYASNGAYNKSNNNSNNASPIQQKDRSSVSPVRSNGGLGDNVQTQYSRASTLTYQELANQQAAKHANSTTYENTSHINNNTNSRSYVKDVHQQDQEEYKVDFDPQILADLQKLKGA